MTQSTRSPHHYASTTVHATLSGGAKFGSVSAGMHAQLLASTVLHDLPKLAEAQRQSLTPLIRAIDVHFPQEMDAAVNQLLQHGHNTDKAAAQQVLQLMQEALAGSAHAPLADAQSTLAVAVDAPSAEMRVLVGFSCPGSLSPGCW